MYEEIAKLVFDYTINNLYADKYFIHRVIDAVMTERKLDGYIIDITYNNDIDGCLYNPIEKHLNISLKECFKGNKFIFSNKILISNLTVVLSIFHELDHTLLAKEEKEGMNTLDIQLTNMIYDIADPKILTMPDEEFDKLSEKEQNEMRKELISSVLKIGRRGCLYNAHNDMAPHERRANINSYIDLDAVFNILSSTSLKDLDKVRLFELKHFLKKCKYGYKTDGVVTNAPSFRYVELAGNIKKLKTIDIYTPDRKQAVLNAKERYSLRERLLYGLPLNDKEFHDINMESNPYNIFQKKYKK